MKWSDILKPEDYADAQSILDRVQKERKEGYFVYPPQKQVLRALDLTPPDKVKAVILGQDPYHAPGQANGLCFSVAPGTKLPPSLRNIFKEYQADLGYEMPSSGDLTPWAEAGVLMLNSILTVRRAEPLSHKSYGWEKFTTAVLNACFQLPQPVVFLLWGGTARAYCAGLPLSSTPGKASLFSSHPSPLGASKGSEAVPAFIGSRPFSHANAELERMGSTPINWKLP